MKTKFTIEDGKAVFYNIHIVVYLNGLYKHGITTMDRVGTPPHKGVDKMMYGTHHKRKCWHLRAALRDVDMTAAKLFGHEKRN